MADAGRGGVVALAVLVGVIVGVAVAGFVAGGRGASTTISTAYSTVTVASTVTETVTSTTVSTSTVASTTTVTSTATVSKPVRVLVDALGRSVVLEGVPRRVASLAPSITETVCMLGYCDRLVLVDKYAASSVEGLPANVTVIGNYWSPSPEEVLAAHPDLVLACRGVPGQERLWRVLGEAGVPVVYLRCDSSRDWRDIEWDVMTVAEVFNDTAAGERLVSWMEGVLANITGAVGNESRPSVALVVYLDRSGAWVAGGGTFQDTMIATAGGRNVFGGRYGWGLVGFEELASRDPDYVIVTVMGGSDAANRTLGLVEGTPLAGTRAWREGRFCVVYGSYTDLVNRPGPRAVLGAELLASILHPGKIAPPGVGGGGVVCSRVMKPGG